MAALCLAGLLPSWSAESEWPTFRGPERNGVATDTGLLSEWPADGPPLVWQAEGVGRGYASPAIADGRIYTIGDGIPDATDGDEYLTCLSQAEGKVLWRSKTGPAWTSGRNESWKSARSTPTVDDRNIYVLTAYGELIRFGNDGSETWRRNLKDDFQGKKADGWGYSESVLIDGPHLICTPGGPENTMVALDKETGELVWSCSRSEDRGAGHASIVISELGGIRVYVQVTGSGAMGVRANNGKLLWTYDVERTTAIIPTPIVRDDLVFFTAGYGLGGALLRQVPSGNDVVKIKEIYPNAPTLQNKHGGVVLYDGYLYGDSGDSGVPFCADLMTGDVMWKSRRGSGKKSASVAAADGHLYFLYSDGTMTLVEATPEEFREQGSFKTPGGKGNRPTWAHPVIADGKLYLREDNLLLCYQLR